MHFSTGFFFNSLSGGCVYAFCLWQLSLRMRIRIGVIWQRSELEKIIWTMFNSPNGLLCNTCCCCFCNSFLIVIGFFLNGMLCVNANNLTDMANFASNLAQKLRVSVCVFQMILYGFPTRPFNSVVLTDFPFTLKKKVSRCSFFHSCIINL